MKILFITPRIPYASVAGGMSIVHQRIRRLKARGHELGVCSLHTPGEAIVSSDPLFTMLSDFETVPAPRPAPLALRAARLLLSSLPPYVHDYRSRVMMRRVGDRVHEGGYDAVVAEFMAMGQYLYRNPYLPAVRKIISSHFSVTRSFQTMAQTWGMSARGLRMRANIGRVMQYELNMYRSVDRVLVFTAHERYQWLNADPTLRIHVIPCGVDTELFCPNPDQAPEEALVFTGQYDAPSNVDAVQWFLATAWPELKRRRPGLTFYVVGPGGPENLGVAAARADGVVVTGAVEDVRPYLHRAMVYVCPVRQGAGIRFKLFEAMAAGVPLVTTTFGAEGIPLQTGDNCFMADRPEIMVECIDLLLGDESLRQSLARRARALAVERFHWDRGVELLEHVLLDTFAH
ncbi:MAG TPA: glycosyltransferase [Kiritimatiellia bacterium]|nr:glycosyltransferase [Kiritimatiellia bacterium]HMO98865.1 glycosyltransferase [Kiritimatiellia bacterium]HMP97286.1 glycosyltransferase [Kiritimatiellia bacterium]